WLAYPHYDVMSNFVVWRGEAYCVSGGLFWSLILDTWEWRFVEQQEMTGRPIVHEESNINDLLIMAGETKGLFSFTRFRPNFKECQKVVNCRVLIIPQINEHDCGVAWRDNTEAGDPVQIPQEIVDFLSRPAQPSDA
ncbi:hypothetical protein PFISCL1PPCAC_28400, partial [Pristionchus fissidentatus]